jgi:hypothetical protein
VPFPRLRPRTTFPSLSLYLSGSLRLLGWIGENRKENRKENRLPRGFPFSRRDFNRFADGEPWFPLSTLPGVTCHPPSRRASAALRALPFNHQQPLRMLRDAQVMHSSQASSKVGAR